MRMRRYLPYRVCGTVGQPRVLAMALLKYFSRSLPELPAPDNLAIEDDKDDDDPFASCDE